MLLLVLVLALAPQAAALLPAEPAAALPCPVGACDVADPSLEDCPGCASESGALPLAWRAYEYPQQCFGEGVSWSTAQARTGAASVRIEDTSTRCTGIVSEPVAIVPGLPYHASMWAKAADGAPQVGVFLAYYLGTPEPPEDYQQYVIKIPFAGQPGADWTEIGGTVSDPIRATHVRLWIYAPTGAAGVTYVDDVTLRAADATAEAASPVA